MSTGVIVNGYEIQNWHTVSILELYRHRQSQNGPVGLPVPVSKPVHKPRSKKMSKGKQVEISEDQIKAWVVANKRDGISLASLSRANGIAAPMIKNRITRFLEANPDFLLDEAAAPIPAAAPVDEIELVELRRDYVPPAVVRSGSVDTLFHSVPELQTLRAQTLEQLPRLAEFLRELRGIEGVHVAGSVSIALSIEAEL